MFTGIVETLGSTRIPFATAIITTTIKLTNNS